MQVICTDGTAFACEGYELTKYGVVLHDQARDPERERYDGDPGQVGFIPHDRLWYILPENVTPNLPGMRATQRTQRQQTGGTAVDQRPPNQQVAGNPAENHRPSDQQMSGSQAAENQHTASGQSRSRHRR